MPADVRAFYDDLAEDYPLIFEDWSRSVRRHGQLIDRLLGGYPQRVLDVACGMGTQALGLALAGHEVVGLDVSEALVARARAEGARLGVAVTFEVGDMREPRAEDRDGFDAVVAFDNALSHLEADEELRDALRTALLAVRHGGRLLASVRDYDALIAERPLLDPPRLLGADTPEERIVLQRWHWDADGRGYELEHILLRRDGAGGWQARTRRGRYRALLRAELERVARAAGFIAMRWHEPSESGFYQPIFEAMAPT